MKSKIAIPTLWEGEHANLSLLDFGHAEVSAEMKNGQVSVGALASIWSPSFSVTFFGVTIEVGAEVGAIGAGIDIGKKALRLKEPMRLAHRLAFHGKRPSNS